jgi:GDP/UDP-N,N'-diacetylbacillosamine 2-epimerase (hydrolysing)
MKKKILAITGIRSDYDLMYPVLNAINKNKNFDLKIVVAGAHLSEWHGFTINSIKADGFKIVDKIDYLLSTNRTTQRSKGVGLLIEGLTQTVDRLRPDILLFAGDREESIATCIVGNYLNILVAHIGGGDPVYGNADDPIRLACSKLAHIHFATAREYAKNIKKLGEEEFRICFSGNPALNNILKTKKINKKRMSKLLNIDLVSNDYIVVLKHPLSSELKSSLNQMSLTMKAIKDFSTQNKIKVIGIYPNTDPGSYDILKVIDKYCSKDIKFFKTLKREVFVNLIRNAKALIGNSSMGILEAPFYKLPVINVGNRQKGRLNAGNVEFLPYDVTKIKKSLKKACFDKKYRRKIYKLKNPYGDGYAHKKIVKFLESVDLKNKKWLNKKKLV